jgi:high-affinity nickel-transport protein
VTRSAAKSGHIPALSRNGEAPHKGTSPVAYLRVDESSPSDEGRFARRRRKGSFVLLTERRMSMATKIARLRWSWRSLTGAERRRVAAMLTAILGVNVFGWATFVLEILPRHFQYKELGVGIGVAVTAWTLGLRHAFDADHIAAIDNTTRKLMADGQRPLGTGFFFALGHASVVMVVGVAITVAAKAVFGAVVTPQSGFASAGGVAGTVLSATFLWLIAALNLVVLVGIAKVFGGMRRGLYDEEELEAQLLSRGLMFRFFARFMNSITRTRQLFFVGFAFGLGFDTATEVLLLGGTAAAVIQGLPWFAVLTLPLLFSGGLMLCDSIDGLFMNFAYGWAFARPVRKVYYNLTITALSVAVAFLVGGMEMLGLLSTELHLHGWLGDYVAAFDLNTAGFIIVGLFVVVWMVAACIWRFGRVEARWEAAAARSRTALAAEEAP